MQFIHQFTTIRSWKAESCPETNRKPFTFSCSPLLRWTGMLSDLRRRWCCWLCTWLCVCAESCADGGSASGWARVGAGAEAGEVDEEDEEEEWTSLLTDETPPAPLDIAGAMSFLPKFSRLLETLLMLSGAVFVMEPELEKQMEMDKSIKGPHTQRLPWLLVWLVVLF